MNQATQLCPTCGAATSGLVCAYCGTLTSPLSDVQDERRAWQEFLTAMHDKSEEEQVKLLQNGFLPDNFQLLTEAGLHCVRLIKLSDPADDVVQSAATRLRATITKLKIIPHTAEGDRAIAEFEKTLAAHQTADKRLNKQVFIGFLVLLLICGAGFLIWWF
jgi:hypothetical protein